ncbi:hypothetical protein V2J52_11610 [Georgenia sp. MJ173]|uniref:hypothetical protein n=1 Tax=Georgenia sunbinii TaxID=3117728 RepID=UPI002F26AEAB
MASVAGLGVVGSLAVPAVVPGATPLPTVATVLPPPTAVEPRVIFSGAPAAASPEDVLDDIWDAVPDGSGESRKRVDTQDPAIDGMFGFTDPSYSPDGSRAVFATVVDSDELGDGQRLMTVDLSDPGATPEPLPSGWTDGTSDDEPAWSDDGSRIAFTRDIIDEGTGVQLRVVDAVTGEVTDPLAELGLTHDEVFGPLAVGSPAWSPDGARIVFDVSGEGPGQLWILDLEEELLLNVVGTDGEPVLGHGGAWSPDGSRLALLDQGLIGGPLVAGALGEPDTAAGTVMIDADVVYGPVSNDPRIGLWGMQEPAWSPDGTEIAVVAENYAGNEVTLGLYGIDVAAGNFRAISVASPVQGVPWGELGAADYQPWSDLAVELTASATAEIEVGDVVDLTATVTNNGPSPAWGASVELELPGASEGLDLAVAWPAECAGDGGYRTCELTEPLAPGESAELTISVVLSEPGGLSADARATAVTPDPLTADNVATVLFEVDFPAATGIEPRLAFGYEHGASPDRRYDVADVLAADATDFRILVDEEVVGGGATYLPEEGAPSYSPDGRRIVFDSDPHVVGSNGSSGGLEAGRTLMLADVGPGPGRATNVRPLDYAYGPNDYDSDPVWSPAGDRVAFRHRDGDGSVVLAVVAVDVSGAVLQEITPEAWGEEYALGELSWSPDGERLVVDTGSELWVVHVDDAVAYPILVDEPDCGTMPGGCLVPLTGEDPAWSPDGTQIAFTQVVGELDGGVYTVPIGAAAAEYVVPAPQRVTQPGAVPLRVEDPTWSLDSGFITFVGRDNAEAPGTLLTVPATGGAPTVLRETFPGVAADVTDPVYQPWADVGVELSGGPGYVDRPFVVSATVTNAGPSPAWGTAVTIEVPAVAAGAATLEAWPESCEPTGATLTCTLDAEALPVGAPVTLDVVLRVTEPATYAVEARVTTRSTDPAQTDNADVLSIGVAALPDSVAEPHLAFTRQATTDAVDTSADVADVPAQGGPADVVRLLAHEAVTTVDGQVLYPDESHPSYSPDGRSLVFSAAPLVAVSGGEDLSPQTRLAVGDLVPDPVPGGDPALTNIDFLEYDVDELAADEEPVWSPDGSRIAFTRVTGFDYGQSVHVLDIESGDVREVTLPDMEGVETMTPSWSPEGDRLVVEMRFFGESTELWIVHLDPAGDTWYPVGTVAPSCTGSPLDCLSPWQGFAPAWSPDGGQLAAGDGWLYGNGPDGYSAIEVLDIPAAPSDGFYAVGGSEILVGTPTFWDGDLPPGQLYAAWHPAWSPDGAQISFVGRATGESYDAISVIPAAGGDPEVRVAEWNDLQPGYYADPAYHPAAGDVAITVDDPGVVVTDAPTELTATVVNAGPGPAWGVTVTFELPPGNAVVDLPAGCTDDGDVVTCVLPDAVPPGGEVDVTVTVALGRPGPQDVTGVVTTSTFDLDTGDNSDVVTIDVQPLAPATGTEPRLAFSYVVDNRQELPSDVADVFWADGEDFRVIADERITDPNGQLHRAWEEDPSYSPDGRQLVFSAERQLDELEDDTGAPVYELDGQAVLMVGQTRPGATGLVDVAPLDYDPPEGVRDVEPAWSPAGHSIAFVRHEGEGSRLGLVEPASGTVTFLEDFANDVSIFAPRNPSWSPDGNYLVVEAGGESSDLWLIDVGGPELLAYPLTARPVGCGDSECELRLDGWLPAWSPDGSSIAFVSSYLNAADEYVDGLFTADVVDLVGTAAPPELIAGLPEDHDEPAGDGDITDITDPAWSLDSTSVAFVGNSGPNSFDDVIYTVPRTGGTPAVLRDTVRPGLDHRFADLAYQPWADLGVTVSVPPAPVVVGAPARVTATVTNHGPSPAWGVVVDIDLPPGAGLAGPVPASCERSGTQLTCTVAGALPAGAAETFTVDVVVESPGSHPTAAGVTSSMIDPVPGNDTGSAAFTAVAPVPPAPGVEPRLAFSYGPDVAGEVPTDIADVFWADGEQFRVIADERVVDPTGRTRWVTETDPSYSPDGRQMVFSAARTVVEDGGSGGTASGLGEATLMVGETRPGLTGLVNIEPLDYQRLEGADDVDPVWSPDGSQIAFVRRAGENIWLAVADVAGGEVRYVEGLPYWIDNPSWSPDGERLVVDATDGQGSMWVVHVDPDGDEVFPVVVDRPACEVSDCPSLTHEPSWSPDGARVAFLDRYPTAGGEWVDGLFTVALPAAPEAGAYQAGPAELLVGPDPATTEPLDELTTLRSPAWSLDGTSLAFVGQGGGEADASVISTIPAGGGSPEVLRDEVRPGVRHEFADLVYQPWADVGVTVTTSAPTAEVGEPVDVTVTVTNHGPSPAWGVAVDVVLPGGVERVGPLPAGCAVAAGALTCRGPEAMPVDATQTFSFTVEAGAAGNHQTVAEVTSRMIDPAPGNDVATAAFVVDPTEPTEPPEQPTPLLTDVVVSLSLDRPTGWVGGDPVTATVVVTAEGPAGAADVNVTLSHPAAVDATGADTCSEAAPCSLGTVAAGASRTVTVDLLPLEAGDGPVTVAATTATQDVDPRNNTATADLEVRQPTLRLLPSVATPGEAVLAYGVDFPPGAELTLEWSRGITPWVRPVTVREDGTVRSPLLILRGDELGERLATAIAAGGPGFGDVEAPPMLVVPRTYSPPNFLTRG